MRIHQALLPLAAAMMIAGCNGSRSTAESVIGQADGALAPIRDNGQMYAPEELKVADGTLAAMKTNLDKHEYKAIVAAVPAFNEQMKTLNTAIDAKVQGNANSTQEWMALNADVPKSVDAIQVRIDTLSKGKLPKGVTKENVATAKTDLETVKTQWADATAAANAGKTTEATEKGRTVQAKVNELKTTLAITDDAPQVASTAQPAGMTPPAGTSAPKKSAAAPAPEAAASPTPASTPAPDAPAAATPASKPVPEAAPTPAPEAAPDASPGSAEPTPPRQ
jgi:hypothetical protein